MTEKHHIEAGTIVAENHDYEVVTAGDYALYDFVPCRRIIDDNGPICAFLCGSVLGLFIEGPL